MKKNILITGISGFVGTNLSHHLERLGYTVYGISRTKKDIRTMNLDILNFEKINEYIKRNKIDICIHLAGESIVEKGQSDPYSTFRINIDGTLNILESARNNKLDRIIIASSSHVYGKNRVPYYEGYTPRPSRPYETSKACVDLIAQSYADTYNLPVLIPRFVNIYGPQDVNYTRLIPKTIKSILSNESPEMWGGNAVRDYLYIDDAVNAFVALMKVDIAKVGKNRIFNFGTGSLTSVRDLMEKILRLSSSDLQIKKIEIQREDEIKNQYVSVSKAKKLLAWTPKVDIDKGLSLTFEWYKDNV